VATSTGTGALRKSQYSQSARAHCLAVTFGPRVRRSPG
jgi:hypothetical protein